MLIELFNGMVDKENHLSRLFESNWCFVLVLLHLTSNQCHPFEDVSMVKDVSLHQCLYGLIRNDFPSNLIRYAFYRLL